MSEPRGRLSASEIEAIRERAEKATPGPWRGFDDGVSWMIEAMDRDEHDDDPWGWLAHLGLVNGRSDMEFIAHAREDIPHLLATVDAQAAQLARADS